MSKLMKIYISLVLVGVLAFAAGFGTFAYYYREFSSGENTFRAAKFEVSDNGTLEAYKTIDFSNMVLQPGSSGVLYEFKIVKGDTEVPVKYNVEIEKEGIFESDVINLKLLRVVSGSHPTQYVWEEISGVDFIPVNNEEKFKISYEWLGDTDDTALAGQNGKITVKVKAEQLLNNPYVVYSNNVYARRKSPTISEAKSQIKIELQTLNDKKYFKINNGPLFGTVKFEINGTNAKLVEIEKEEYNYLLEKSFSINKTKIPNFVSFGIWGANGYQEHIIEVTLPPFDAVTNFFNN